MIAEYRWWSWQDGVAHARRYRARGQAVCGARLHRLACYATGPVTPCPRCLALLAADAPPLTR